MLGYGDLRHGRTEIGSVDTRAYSFDLSDAIKRVLLGEVPAGVQLSERAIQRLSAIRATFESGVRTDTTVIAPEGALLRRWTFAGARANAVLSARGPCPARRPPAQR